MSLCQEIFWGHTWEGGVRGRWGPMRPPFPRGARRPPCPILELSGVWWQIDNVGNIVHIRTCQERQKTERQNLDLDVAVFFKGQRLAGPWRKGVRTSSLHSGKDTVCMQKMTRVEQ